MPYRSDADCILQSIVQPTLKHLETHCGIPATKAASQLLMMTAAHESAGFRYMRQIKGPARSMWQIEPATFRSHVLWVKSRETILEGVKLLAYSADPDDWVYEYTFDQRLACAFARIHYRRVRAPLPAVDDLEGMGAYAKRYYNTAAGKARPADYVDAYDSLCSKLDYAS